MSEKQKETANIAGDWLYRGVAIYFLWNIYTDVQMTNRSTPVFQERLDRHELRLKNIEDNVFTPAWNKPSNQSTFNHSKETDSLMNTVEENLAQSRDQLDKTDVYLYNLNSN